MTAIAPIGDDANGAPGVNGAQPSAPFADEAEKGIGACGETALPPQLCQPGTGAPGVITKTLEERGPGQDMHWSTRSMAAATGMSQSAISRIWRAFGLKPHLVQTWKLSTDPQFIEKVRDVVGLYLDPPEKAPVLCVDDKSQIQALDRTAPCLPVLPTTPARMTHDYVRHGTTSLFAALEVASGSVIAQRYRRHRHQKFLRFLKLIDDAVPDGLDLHLIRDNYATHKTPECTSGCCAIPASTCTSRPPAPHGSTPWSGGSPS